MALLRHVSGNEFPRIACHIALAKSEGRTEKTELPKVATDRLLLHARWDRVGSDCGSVGCLLLPEEGCHPPRERRAIGCHRGSSNRSRRHRVVPTAIVPVTRRNGSAGRCSWRRRRPMHVGVAMFCTDYAIAPTELARALEERGFESLWLPEHSHIPLSPVSAFPHARPLPTKYFHL